MKQMGYYQGLTALFALEHQMAVLLNKCTICVGAEYRFKLILVNHHYLH